MRQIAIIGSGPAGYYAAEAFHKLWGEAVRVDLIDRLPTPFGLIRAGVAPDHQSIKAVSKRYEATSATGSVRFVGNVMVGQDVTIPELLDLYDAVVLATGAPADRPLAIPGADLSGVVGSAAFVGWYNGHPQFAELEPALGATHAVVIGNGNVALDVARILAKTPAEFHGSDIAAHAASALERSAVRDITILGRRGPAQVSFTPKELGEMGHLARANAVADTAQFAPLASDAALDPGLRKAVALLRGFAVGQPLPDRPVTVRFRFLSAPVAIEGDGRAERLVVEESELGDDGTAHPTGKLDTIPAGLIVSCIGYRSHPIPGVPYDDRAGRFTNTDGRIAPGLYAVGWARRGPSGTIGTNRPDGYAVADLVAADLAGVAEAKPGGSGLDALLVSRHVAATTYADWQRIDAAEIARAPAGSPREKFVRVDDMLATR